MLLGLSLAACRQPQYATIEGEASVRLAPAAGDGMTIEADGLYVLAVDYYENDQRAFTSRGVGIYDRVATPGACFDGEAELELELVSTVSMMLTTGTTEGSVVFGDLFEDPAIGLDAEGSFSGPLEVYSAAVAVCEGLERSTHDLVVEWSLDESTRVVHYDTPTWDGMPCVGCTNAQ